MDGQMDKWMGQLHTIFALIWKATQVTFSLALCFTISSGRAVNALPSCVWAMDCALSFRGWSSAWVLTAHQPTWIPKCKKGGERREKQTAGRTSCCPSGRKANGPCKHVVSLHVQLCHRSLVTGQFTGPFHSSSRNTQIYGQINWVQQPLVLLGLILLLLLLLPFFIVLQTESLWLLAFLETIQIHSIFFFLSLAFPGEQKWVLIYFSINFETFLGGILFVFCFFFLSKDSMSNVDNSKRLFLLPGVCCDKLTRGRY